MPFRSAIGRIAVSISTALAIAAVAAAPAAHADADPASDFLLAAPVFYPYQPATSPAIKTALEGTLAKLKREGLNLKVAIIDSPNDLGGVSNLWRMPQPYADFLGKEISFNQKQPLLVVMPPGFGVYGMNSRSALNGLMPNASQQADGLARSAITAVVRLGQADGKQITEPTIRKEASSGKGTPALIVFGAPVLLVAIAALIALTRRTHDSEPDQEEGESAA
ncbi:MAG: hypothetical protein ACTHM1_00145 [Solirubrobacteraceae bacterium]